ncbi:MAG: hypothetical protein ACREO5_14595, partial [Candidatus Binatia bacterium]
QQLSAEQPRTLEQTNPRTADALLNWWLKKAFDDSSSSADSHAVASKWFKSQETRQKFETEFWSLNKSHKDAFHVTSYEFSQINEAGEAVFYINGFFGPANQRDVDESQLVCTVSALNHRFNICDIEIISDASGESN